MRTRLTTLTLLSLITSLLLFVALALPMAAQSEAPASPAPEAENTELAERAAARNGATRSSKRSDAALARKAVLEVHHGPVEVDLADRASDGHQLGDLRVASVETTTAAGRPLGRLDATLTTTSIDVPDAGDERRISSLVFSFGNDGQHQVVVSGSAVHPAQGSTIATGDTTVRPIVGGSGRFDGASGSAATRHLDDDTWVHYLKLDRAKSKVAREAAAKQRVTEWFQRWRSQRKEALGQRKEAVSQRREAVDARSQARLERRDTRVERREARAERRAARRDERAADGAPRSGPAADDAAEVGITRTDLGIAEPGSAPGEELGLWRYSIPAGSELASHTHPGWQLARIISGELEYEVVAGEGTLLRADGTSQPMGPGTYILRRGDGVIEDPELIHQGANRTDRPVTIIAATLYPAGATLSTPIELIDGDPGTAEADAAG